VNTLHLLTICVSLVIGVTAIASIFVNGWVKASHISELKVEIKELWNMVTKVNVLESRIESIGKDISEIKEMLRK
jgi:hypothetical protein